MPKISVIIPTYNRESFLKDAIQSVLDQTFKNFELLIIDDGSTDATEEMIRKNFHDNRIRYIYKRNEGVASARNLGIKEAQSDWLAFLDSDDRWYPEKLENQFRFLINNSHIKICQTEDIWFRNGKRFNPKKKHAKKSGWIFSYCVELCTVCCSTIMLHKDIFRAEGLFDESLAACEDYDLWLRLSLKYPIITLSHILAWKQGGHSDQLSQKYWGMDIFRVRALQKILNHSDISYREKKLVRQSLKSRYDVLELGAKKRGKTLAQLLNLGEKDLIKENSHKK